MPTPKTETTCGLCHGKKVTTWRYFDSLTPTAERQNHTFCHDCRGHHYKGKWITKAQWEADMENYKNS